MRWHHLRRSKRRATPRIPRERFDRAERLAATEMAEHAHIWRSIR